MAGTRRRRRLLTAGAAVIVLVASVVVILRLRGDGHETAGKGGTSGDTTAQGTRVEARTGTDTTFRFGGREHTVRLLSSSGRAAMLQFSSDPTMTVLSTTQPEGLDLTGDTVPDATASLAAVSATQVTVQLTPIAPAAWNESGFQTGGGLRSWDVVPADGTPMPALVDDGRGGLMLFTIASNRNVSWQRYRTDGSFVAAPTFGAGLLERVVSPRYAVTGVDAMAVPGGFVVATELELAGSNIAKGIALTPYDLDLRPLGPPLRLPGYRPRIAYDGARLWVAATDGRVLSLTQVTPGTSLAAVHTYAPVTPPAGRSDGLPAITVDASTSDLVLAFDRSSGTAGQVHVAVVDPATGTARRTVQVASSFWHDTKRHSFDAPEVLAAGGQATVQWLFGTAKHLYTARVDTATGTVSGRTDQVRTAVTGNHAILGESRLVTVGGATYLLGLCDSVQTEGALNLARYLLFRLGASGFEAASPLTLDGGFPVRPDVLVVRDSYKQVPEKAVAGAQVVFEAAVTNRGTQSARQVFVDVLIGDGVIGTVNLGTLAAMRAAQVAVGWTVPADTTAEQTPVHIRVRTASEQYTTGNDALDGTLRVLQKGLVSGFVIDDSADINRSSDWSTGLAGAQVTIGDVRLLTDLAGFFRVDELDFGTYQLTVTKPGYRTVGATVELKRTRPFGLVALHTDDHGILEVRIVDGNGAALNGADLTIVDARRTDRTDPSGILRYDISKGTYRLAAAKRGYTAVTDQEATVNLGQTTVVTLTLPAASAATATGRVVDQHGEGVGGATIDVIDARSNTTVQTATSGESGAFGPLTLPAESTRSHPYVLSAHKAGIAYTATDSLNVYGGDATSSLLALVPEASGELHGVSASEGYTSWMIHEGFPGFAVIPGADMYVWMGNYGVKVSAEFWDSTHELVGVDVSVQGNSYESHATKSEIDFTEMKGSDFNEMFETTTIQSDASGKLDLGGFFLEIVKSQGLDLKDLAGDVADLFGGGEDITETQDKRLITWKEGKEDFRVIPEFDSGDPVRSVFDIVVSIPTSFAIPVVIGGSSVEVTSVRVDQVDVVDASTYEVLWSSTGGEWFSWQGADGASGVNTKRYTVPTAGIDVRNVFVEVFLNVGKIRPSAVGGSTDVYGTSFDQREQQVVIFRPSTKAMLAQIAPGDLYRHGELVRIND